MRPFSRLSAALLAAVIVGGAALIGCGGTEQQDTSPVEPDFELPAGASWKMKLSGELSGEPAGTATLLGSGDPTRINLSGVTEGEQTTIDLYVPISKGEAKTVQTSRRTTLTRTSSQYHSESPFVVTIETYTDQRIRGAFRGTLTLHEVGNVTEKLAEPLGVIGRFDFETGQ